MLPGPSSFLLKKYARIMLFSTVDNTIYTVKFLEKFPDFIRFLPRTLSLQQVLRRTAFDIDMSFVAVSIFHILNYTFWGIPYESYTFLSCNSMFYQKPSCYTPIIRLFLWYVFTKFNWKNTLETLVCVIFIPFSW